MLCLVLIVFYAVNISTGSDVNVGTAIFYDKYAPTCWTGDEVAKLRARKHFQNILPTIVSPDKMDKQYIYDALRFYRKALYNVENGLDQHTSTILKQALSDAIGGHLRSQMLPTVRFAYYAGHVPYKPVREIHELLEEIKTYLNTKGIGWKEADKVPEWSNLTVTKLLVGFGKPFDPCSTLITKRDSNKCIHLPAPKLDDSNEPTAIALPFKFEGLVSLTAQDSENIVLKYYITASSCILRRSPENCRHYDLVNFNNELWHWMKRDVAPHLSDEKLYVAYSGVLRIAAAVQSYGKGLSRRNLFENQYWRVSKWRPWHSLTQSYLYVNTDWSPCIYVGIVLVIALIICMLQICYSYVFGGANRCRCRKTHSDDNNDNIDTKEVAYTSVETTFPSILPSHHSFVKINDKSHRCVGSKTGGSVKTQPVYDLNENAEKLIEVIMKGSEQSDSSLSDCEPKESKKTNNTFNRATRQRSPPELEVSISQLKVDKSNIRKMMPLYTSSTTQSDVTYKQASESQRTDTESSSSDHSSTSGTSKTRCLNLHNTRDLAWPKRLVSKNLPYSQTRSTTVTDFDNSFTTPH